MKTLATNLMRSTAAGTGRFLANAGLPAFRANNAPPQSQPTSESGGSGHDLAAAAAAAGAAAAIAARGARADDDKDETDKDEEKEKGKRGKGSKKGQDDGDDADDDKDKEARAIARGNSDEGDREDYADPVTRAARSRERRRIQAIMGSAPAQLNPTAAAHMAYETSMPRHEAIGMLGALVAAMPPPAPPRTDQLRERMSGQENPNVGNDDEETNRGNVAAFIVAANERRLGNR